MPTAGWIIPPSLRYNGPHCLLVHMKKLVGEFSSTVALSLCWELPNFSHLKQGNCVRPCMAYVLSHNGVAITGDSLVDQYPSTLVHIAGFKFLKNQANILQVLEGMRGLGWGVRGFYKD